MIQSIKSPTASIPIDAYGPRYFMAPQHVDPIHAVRIHGDIGSRYSIPIHWGTFQLTHEPFLEPPRLVHQNFIDSHTPQANPGWSAIDERLPAGMVPGAFSMMLVFLRIRRDESERSGE